MIPFMLLGAAMSRKIAGGRMPAGSYVASICMYSFAAALLVTLGIGSIQARRWARALNLILSWVGLITGTFATIVIAVFLPRGFLSAFQQAAAKTPNTAPLSTAAVAAVLTFVIVFLSILLIVVPLAFLLFFGRKDVEETCKRRDPVERWTDRCPLPVLALSLILGFGGTYALLLAITTPMLPFFGRYLTGLPASGGLGLLAGVYLALAFGIYRRRPAAWSVTIVFATLRLISAFVTYRRGDLFRAYSEMGWSQGQLEQLRSNPMIHSGVGWGLVLTVIFLAYLLWIRRYFKAPAAVPPSSDVPQIPAQAGPATS